MNERKYGFTLLRSREMAELGGVLHELEHDVTGARLIWLQRPDYNKTIGIGFPTLPDNSTGVCHILEHSVLSGSQRYPVREPFVELLKNSMNTFLNAMTFPDKTVYPVSSRNNKDFLNLVRVYLDAVFHPLIYTRPEIFWQEGWHYEFDEQGNPSYKGVVFNEMKGAYANADRLLDGAIAESMFPGHCYRFSSGGDPAVIPDLSYEEFIAFHRSHYSPTNAYIFLDGDVDMDAVLQVIQEEYLADYERGERVEYPAMQQPVSAGVKRIRYELSPKEDPERKFRAAWARVIGTFADREVIIGMEVLSRALCSGNQSPLVKCILDKGLAEDVSLDIQDGVQQPMAVLEVQNFREADLTEIRNLLNDELKRQADGALDHSQVEAQMANLEFRMRERDYGTMPRGLINGISLMETWLYGGDPAANLQVGDLFDRLREKLAQGWFEDLIRRMLLDNPHSCCVVMEPSHTLGEERRQAEQDRLAAEAAAWTPEQKAQLKANQEKLQAWQATEDSPEDLATLPRLAISDISAEPEHLPIEEVTVNGLQVWKHTIPCSGIVYGNLYFDVSDRNEEGLARLSFLGGLLGELPTRRHSAEELQKLIRMTCGGVSAGVKVYPHAGEPEHCEVKFCVSFSALETKLPQAVELVKEILTETVFEDESAVLDILRQDKTGMARQISAAGNRVAVGRISAMLTSGGVAEEHTGGYCHYLWLKNREADWNWEAMQADLLDAASVLCRSRLTVSVTGTLADCAETVANAMDLPEGTVGTPVMLKPWGLRREGIAVPGDVAYAACGGSLLERGVKYTGIMPLASRIIGLGYLWNVIRVQGGAYGTGLMARNTGTVCCWSYRDPTAARSLEQYQGAADFLAQLCESGADLTGFIIGAVSDDSPLMTPRIMGSASDSRRIVGVTDELLRRKRQELLAANHESLLALTKPLADTLRNGGVCVIGSQPQLDQIELDEVLSL